MQIDPTKSMLPSIPISYERQGYFNKLLICIQIPCEQIHPSVNEFLCIQISFKQIGP